VISLPASTDAAALALLIRVTRTLELGVESEQERAHWRDERENLETQLHWKLNPPPKRNRRRPLEARS
jgi:hypothetical protein